MFGTLLHTAWRRHRHLRWSLSVGLFLMGLLLAGTYQVFGSGFIPDTVFQNSGLAWAVASAATSVAREVEDGTIEFLLSRPVDRRVMLGARIIAWAAGSVVLLLADFLGTMIGILFFEALADFPLAGAVRLPLSLVPMLVLVGGVAFLASAGSSARSRVYAAALGFTVGSYFLNFAATLWDPLGPVAPFSFFHYVSPGEWARDGIQLGPAAVMVLLGIALFGLALTVIDRRDFSV